MAVPGGASIEYHSPTTIDDAVALLADGAGTIVAGGTDFYPARAGRPVTESVIDISGLTDLRGIQHGATEIRIGALTTWTDIIRADLPPAFRALQQAAAEVGGVQVQNAGTVAGNLCNASPAADGVPPLLALDASVELTGPSGRRILTLPEFITGYRQTALAADEIMTAVVVPTPARSARAAFQKLGSRRYLVISIVMVAVTMTPDSEGAVERAAVSVGASGPVASRLGALESDLVSRHLTDLASVVRREHFDGLSPIDDVRAPAAYRRAAALTLTRRALHEVGSL